MCAKEIKMATTVLNSIRRGLYPSALDKFLPPRLVSELRELRGSEKIEEIRLRAFGRCSLTVSNGNIFLNTALTRQELGSTLARMCGNSLYAHKDTINNGYLTLEGGIRVGICGRAATADGNVLGVYDISALNIRLPSPIRSVGEPVCRLIKGMKQSSGVLVYSPPGVGKTTLLRSVAYNMSSGAEAWRVALIDTRGELGCFEEMRGVSMDILSGYPKGIGIEIAARTMNAQLMVCDEIGGEGEARSIISAQNCGVPLLASAHGDTVRGLLRRTEIYRLHKAGVFGVYVGIERLAGKVDYRYTVTTAGEADAFLQDSGSVNPRV